MRKPQLAMLALVALAVVQMLYFNHRIDKAIVAAHFNAPGDPNGWHTKAPFFSLYILVAALGLWLSFGLSFVFTRLPAQVIILPNREYWLAPARRDQTVRRIADHFAWIGAATVALVLVELQVLLTMSLSLNPHVHRLAVILPVVLYVPFAVWMFARLNHSFSRQT